MGDFVNGIIRYFDLQSDRRNLAPQAHAGGAARHAPVLPQYAALVLGIIVEPFLHHYIAQGTWAVDVSALVGRIAFGVIIGAMVFPGVYKSSFDPTKPLALQLCAIFSAGIGWQSLIQGGSKVIS